jgi:hypothetical protein
MLGGAEPKSFDEGKVTPRFHNSQRALAAQQLAPQIPAFSLYDSVLKFGGELGSDGPKRTLCYKS